MPVTEIEFIETNKDKLNFEERISNARLWEFDNRSKEYFCLFLLDVPYSAQIIQEGRFFYRGDDPDKKRLKLVAIKQTNDPENPLEFKAAFANYIYYTDKSGYQVKKLACEKSELIQNTKAFCDSYLEHRLKYLHAALAPTASYKKIETKLKQLRNEVNNYDNNLDKKGGAAKTDALEKLKAFEEFSNILHRWDSNFFQYFEEKNPKFQAITKPRVVRRNFLLFFKTFQAASFKKTDTYNLLTKLQATPQYEALLAENKRQTIETLNNLAKNISASL